MSKDLHHSFHVCHIGENDENKKNPWMVLESTCGNRRNGSSGFRNMGSNNKKEEHWNMVLEIFKLVAVCGSGTLRLSLAVRGNGNLKTTIDSS